MHIIEAVFLGLIQGLTEFIPISSSAHLFLAEKLLNLQVNGFVFDAMLNFGTLGALTLYFRRELLNLVHDFFQGGPQHRLAWLVIIATIPAAGAGVLLQDLAETTFRSALAVAGALVGIAVAMFVVEKYAQKQKNLSEITVKDSLIIGLAQVLAFVPGTSRSGVTITAGMAQDLKRQAAARFSFLLSIPILGGGALKVLFDDGVLEQVRHDLATFMVGIAVAFISGYLAVTFLLNYLRNHSLVVFAWYRIGLAIVVLAVTLLR